MACFTGPCFDPARSSAVRSRSSLPPQNPDFVRPSAHARLWTVATSSSRSTSSSSSTSSACLRSILSRVKPSTIMISLVLIAMFISLSLGMVDLPAEPTHVCGRMESVGDRIVLGLDDCDDPFTSVVGSVGVGVGEETRRSSVLEDRLLACLITESIGGDSIDARSSETSRNRAGACFEGIPPCQGRIG